MNILECHDLKKEFDGKVIFDQAGFFIEARDKMALVGINGAGKTTLLKVLIGELAPENGSVVRSRDMTIGYLAQNQNIDSENTIYRELLSEKKELLDIRDKIISLEEAMGSLKGDELLDAVEEHDRLSETFSRQKGFNIEGDVIGVARGLGFSDDELDKEIRTLSGGQKTRVALAKLLLKNNDLIILDEPTNHLDMRAAEWLENYLKNYSGAVLIVSHDRFFLDRIVNRVLELDSGKLTVWSGNYSDYAKSRAKAREDALKAYLNQQKEIRRQEAVIEKLKSYNREKSIKRAESREKLLSKVKRLEKPVETKDDMQLKLVPFVESGNDVLKAEHLNKSFGSNILFTDISFEIKRGEHVAIIGNNGTGKTTLLNIINNLLPADSGEVTLGVRVKTAYYDQEHHVLHDENTLFDEISDAHPDMTETEIRNRLAAFLFTGDDVFKKIKSLSGGEKGRLSLLKLMLSKANFLLLDEPTNHLDILSREILEGAVRDYDGTVLYVSHDRYFINRTATRILDLTDRQLINYIGDYDYYSSHRAERMKRLNVLPAKTSAQSASSPLPSTDDSRSDWQAQKEERNRQKKRELELKKCEEEIAALEERLKEIDAELAKPEIGADYEILRKLSDEQAEINIKLETLYSKWEKLA